MENMIGQHINQRLSQAQVETYRERAMLHPLPALSSAEVGDLYTRNHAHADVIKLRNNQKPYLFFTWLAQSTDRRRGRGPARSEPLVLDFAVLRQAGGRFGLRELVPGFNLLRALVARRCDGLGRADAEHVRIGLHAGDPRNASRLGMP